MSTPVVRYRYSVGENTYVGDTINYGGVVSSSFRSIAEKVVKKYQHGKVVKVYVSPEDPNISVLEPGFHYGSVITILVGVLFVAIGAKSVLMYTGIDVLKSFSG